MPHAQVEEDVDSDAYYRAARHRFAEVIACTRLHVLRRFGQGQAKRQRGQQVDRVASDEEAHGRFRKVHYVQYVFCSDFTQGESQDQREHPGVGRTHVDLFLEHAPQQQECDRQDHLFEGCAEYDGGD